MNSFYIEITENDMRGLELIASSGGQHVSYPSAVGFALYPVSKLKSSKRRRAQGMALCGARVMRRLERAGLITIRYTHNSNETIYKLTDSGRKAINKRGST